jgi:hypothetical protein
MSMQGSGGGGICEYLEGGHCDGQAADDAPHEYPSAGSGGMAVVRQWGLRLAVRTSHFRLLVAIRGQDPRRYETLTAGVGSPANLNFDASSQY